MQGGIRFNYDSAGKCGIYFVPLQAALLASGTTRCLSLVG